MWSDEPQATHIGQTFPALCNLWVMAQEIATVYTVREKESLQDRVSLAFAESKYQKLLAWADSLDTNMLRNELNSAPVLFFQ
jgi:hypothetical protein